jgi:hypothetical protein
LYAVTLTDFESLAFHLRLRQQALSHKLRFAAPADEAALWLLRQDLADVVLLRAEADEKLSAWQDSLRVLEAADQGTFRQQYIRYNQDGDPTPQSLILEIWQHPQRPGLRVLSSLLCDYLRESSSLRRRLALELDAYPAGVGPMASMLSGGWFAPAVGGGMAPAAPDWLALSFRYEAFEPLLAELLGACQADEPLPRIRQLLLDPPLAEFMG